MHPYSIAPIVMAAFSFMAATPELGLWLHGKSRPAGRSQGLEQPLAREAVLLAQSPEYGRQHAGRTAGRRRDHHAPGGAPAARVGGGRRGMQGAEAFGRETGPHGMAARGAMADPEKPALDPLTWKEKGD